MHLEKNMLPLDKTQRYETPEKLCKKIQFGMPLQICIFFRAKCIL